jgi:hypothetical protein
MKAGEYMHVYVMCLYSKHCLTFICVIDSTLCYTLQCSPWHILCVYTANPLASEVVQLTMVLPTEIQAAHAEMAACNFIH